MRPSQTESVDIPGDDAELPKRESLGAGPDTGADAPSLRLYLLLFLASALLVRFSIRSGDPDWKGLSANLATELLGALVVFVFVDRKFRANEVGYFKVKAATLRSLLAMALSPRARHVHRYLEYTARYFGGSANGFFIHRPHLQHRLRHETSNLLLVGGPGTGKTTILHYLFSSHAQNALRDVGGGRVPFMVHARNVLTDLPLETNVYLSQRRGATLSEREILQLVHGGRAVLIFDSIDEVGPEALAALRTWIDEVVRRHPRNQIVLSSRHVDELQGLHGFTTIEMPAYTRDELRSIREWVKHGSHRQACAKA